MTNEINLILGAAIIILNLIPMLTKRWRYLGITIPLSLLLAAIRVLFISN